MSQRINQTVIVNARLFRIIACTATYNNDQRHLARSLLFSNNVDEISRGRCDSLTLHISLV